MVLQGSLRSMVGQLRGGRRSIATSTTPKMKPATLDAEHAHHANIHGASNSSHKIGEWAPVQIVFGMVSVAVMLAAHTAYQQLVRSPSVHVNKKRRESMPEVDEPDLTIDSADKFINRSMLRKVAHIQENKNTLSDPVHPNPFTHPRTAETLKTAGVEPGTH
ncbi:uncharacterized protein LOC129300605 isoform X2 [Prosopis cineraria]|uniref:uncharacterized protein LOC129300605 isoform X2 n=1 Tax=Prosopis cineraria TaxID=364024 RepID=UPI00240EF398|nr:uncharacterized protein LOC129300605 isoform X2 [Prosopis cineraria]